MEEISQRYFALDDEVRDSAWYAARKADEVVDVGFRYVACGAVYDTTKMVVFGYATCELIGNVDNKVAYELIMSYKKS